MKNNILKLSNLKTPVSSPSSFDGRPIVLYGNGLNTGFLLEDAMEIWKDIYGWEGVYQISNHGRLKSFKADLSGRILSLKNKNGDYLAFVLCAKDRASQSCRVHRLVAEAFIKNPENKKEVNHIDGNKQNNHVKNLEWSSRKENYDHARKTGLSNHQGMKKYNQKIRPKSIIQKTLDGHFVRYFVNAKEASKSTGVCQRNILQVAGKTEYKPGKTRKQAGGFIWEFQND